METQQERNARWETTSAWELSDLLNAWESNRDDLEAKSLLGGKLTKSEQTRLSTLSKDCEALADHLNSRG